jgi:SAM-dependent methyltransferase
MEKKKEILKKIARYLIPVKSLLERLAEIECWLASQWASSSHMRLMAIQWGIPPQPEYFDHNINLFYHWAMSRSPLWLERGAFGSLTLKGGDLLELACGDGFNTRNFYSLQSRHVIAIDFEPKAIQLAKKKNSAPNIEYLLSDIRENMPNGKFDNIVWDGAIEHFTPSEIEKIMINIKARLTANGILSGYTIVEKKRREKISFAS